MLITTVCALTVLAYAGQALAAPHPASGREVNELPAGYGTADYGRPAAWSADDLTFGGPYPRAVELTASERYMLAGTQPTHASAGDGLPAWIDAAAGFCLDYYNYFGVLPAQLDAEALAALRQVQGLAPDPLDRALTLNPLTGAVPSLAADEFSAGDLFVRPLTNVELRRFAERRPELYDNWFRGRQTDPATGRTGRVELLSEVLYVRAWGAQGVLFENLVYRLSEPVYDQPQRIAIAPSYTYDRGDDDWDLDGSCATSS
jgi:hypothetical protein